MRWLNPSAVLNFRKPSMDFEINKPGVLRFTPKVHRCVRNSSVCGKMSTAARRARDCGPLGNEKPESVGLWFAFSSGEWIRTTDFRVMSKDTESVPFVRRVLQTLAPAASADVSQTDERWFLLARHAAVVDRCAYSICLCGFVKDF